MKTTSTISRFLAVSAIALAVPMTAMAFGPHHGGRDFQNCDRAEMRGGHGMPNLRGIDLTAAQVTQLSALRDEQRKLFDDKFQAMRDQREALHKLAMSDAYTPAAAADLSAKLAATHAELTKARAEHANKLYKILTPEQRTKMQQNMLTDGGSWGRGRGRGR